MSSDQREHGQSKRDEELLRMARWLADQPFNRDGTDKTEVVLYLWDLVQSFQAARPVEQSADATLD